MKSGSVRWEAMQTQERDHGSWDKDSSYKGMRSGNILSSFLKVDPRGLTDRFQSISVAMRGSGNPEWIQFPAQL